MKKCLLLLLVLVLLIPSAASAFTGDSPFFGKWIAQKHGSTANYSAILYYLTITQYKTTDYFEFYLHHGGAAVGQGKISNSYVYSGAWEIVDDHLKIPTSGIEYIEVYYDAESDTLYTTSWPKLTFVRIP